MVHLGEQAGGIAAVAARMLLERKNQTHWSNRDLAEALGWSHNTVDRYLHGERVMPIDAFYRLARLLGVDPAHILKNAERTITAASTQTPLPR